MYDHTMSFGLGEDIDAMRDMVRRFVRDEIAPKAADIDRDNDFPAGLWEKMGAASTDRPQEWMSTTRTRKAASPMSVCRTAR